MTTAIHSPSQRDHNEDRMRRAISWFDISLNTETPDEEFIFLWISFNAAYGVELRHPDAEGDSPSEFQKFSEFLKDILYRDTKGEIESRLTGRKLAGRISHLLRNQFIYEPFWRSLREAVDGGDEAWQNRFGRRNELVSHSFRKLSAPDLGSEEKIDLLHGVLVEVFLRLYTLRNQVFHGGATYGTGRGRKQIKDGSFIMANLVPVILDIMEADIDENPSSDVWGEVAYSSSLLFEYDDVDR
ncbi:MAG: HEPN domain-containing protein [Dehalococcoidia bacterium]|nr:HEPN domain-containing protein [Dehalococcoidia bacterium]